MCVHMVLTLIGLQDSNNKAAMIECTENERIIFLFHIHFDNTFAKYSKFQFKKHYNISKPYRI